MLAAASQPAGRQTQVTMTTGAPDGMSAVLKPDALHLRDAPGAAWRALPFSTETRLAMTEKALETKPPTDCQRVGNEQMNGSATHVFSFTQPSAETADKTITLRIWIGLDGLPRRMQVSSTSAVDYEYGDFPVP